MDMSSTPVNAALLQQAMEGFEQAFGGNPTHYGYAPGRVELLGNHTDYNGGSVICAALDLGLLAVARPMGGNEVRVQSQLYADKPPETIPLDHIVSCPASRWADYVRGTIFFAQREKIIPEGFDLFLASNLRRGSGLSSSAAIELATLHVLLALTEQTLDRLKAAKTARKAENEFVGVPCGLMDQFAASFGEQDHALYLDCHSEEHAAMPLGHHDVAIVVMDSQTHHSLADGQYARLRNWCESAARKINRVCGRSGKEEQLLRHVSQADFEEHAHLLSAEEQPRAEHVLHEHGRVLAGREALLRGDVLTFAELMTESHESSRTLFGNSCHELDECLALAKEISKPGGPAEGAWMGGKLSGGGFGGATVNLVKKDEADAFCRAFAEAFQKARGVPANVLVTQAGDGARHGTLL